MNQRVTARIVGGKRFTTAEYREYFNASRILRDQANRLGTSRRSFIAAGYELKIHPRATPLLSALTGQVHGVRRRTISNCRTGSCSDVAKHMPRPCNPWHPSLMSYPH